VRLQLESLPPDANASQRSTISGVTHWRMPLTVGLPPCGDIERRSFSRASAGILARPGLALGVAAAAIPARPRSTIADAKGGLRRVRIRSLKRAA